MKQILQSFRTGQTELCEVPVPLTGNGQILVKTTRSLVSLGTERALVEFARSGLIEKARKNPERVKQVVEKIRSEGLWSTMQAVFNRLEQPLPLGYCNVGIVKNVGEGVSGFAIGDRVVCNGPHAEYVCVPKNLASRIPDNITDEEATFTIVGAIGLQGIRLCIPGFGETIAVVGMGLIGLLTVQLLLAGGCKVIGIDIDEKKCALAEKWGADTINPSNGTDPVKAVQEITGGTGADGVIITASSKNNDIISRAALMSRKRGRIILVGVTGLNLNRAEFYEKELSFQVSCSYGPGRYDEQYEQKGIDYPLPFVRWTEKRNFEAILQAISNGQLKVKELITDIVNLEDFRKIYDNLGQSKSIASIIRYPETNAQEKSKNTVILNSRSYEGSKAVIGVIGAGNFTKMTMLPSLKKSGAMFKYIASSGGVTGTALAKKYGFTHSTTDYTQILNDPDVDTVFIATRHNSHARFVIEAMKSGKNIFVEKPLALNMDQLNEIIQVYSATGDGRQATGNRQTATGSLTVGFNRRFSPHIRSIKKTLGDRPVLMNIVATMNAGYIPQNFWIQDIAVGGGRIIGEACHYFDLCVYLTGSEIDAVCMNALGENPTDNTDNASILLKFKNGSNAVINYFANGAKSYSKERVEVFSQGRIFIVDNFRSTKAFGAKGFKNIKTRIDKGHKNQFYSYIKLIQFGGNPLIPFNEIINVTKASFAAIQSLREKRWITV